MSVASTIANKGDFCDNTAMKRLMTSFGHATMGIKEAAKGRNFRIQLAVGVLAVVLGLALNISAQNWIAIIFAGGLVLALEATNTAIEEICNKFHPETHPHIALIKNLSAGAVLIASLAALIVGIMVFGPLVF